MTISVFLHLYYLQSIPAIDDFLKYVSDNYQANILINVNMDNPAGEDYIREAREKYPNLFLTKSTNIGKDIGGKLVLMDLYLKLGLRSDVIVFLHDKKSPQALNGERWRTQLFNIIDVKNVDRILDLLKDPKVGMVANQDMIFSLKDDFGKKLYNYNKPILEEYALRFNLDKSRFLFVGGTIFWVKGEVFEKFFGSFNPFEIRGKLEAGNVIDNFEPSQTHSWERLFGWIVSNERLKIAGI